MENQIRTVAATNTGQHNTIEKNQVDASFLKYLVCVKATYGMFGIEKTIKNL